MIIGLTGKNGAGKGAVAEYLVSRGYCYYSLSDALRDELKKMGREITRENLIKTGQELRVKYGPGVLAEMTIKKLVNGLSHVIDSFRHPAEAMVFKSRRGFIFWRVEADEKIRFERCLKRGREQEAGSFEHFLEVEKKEFNTGDKSKQDLLGTLELADTAIENNSTIEDLHKRIEAELEKIEKA